VYVFPDPADAFITVTSGSFIDASDSRTGMGTYDRRDPREGRGQGALIRTRASIHAGYDFLAHGDRLNNNR
jgi:hypothetical protein